MDGALEKRLNGVRSIHPGAKYVLHVWSTSSRMLMGLTTTEQCNQVQRPLNKLTEHSLELKVRALGTILIVQCSSVKVVGWCLCGCWRKVYWTRPLRSGSP